MSYRAQVGGESGGLSSFLVVEHRTSELKVKVMVLEANSLVLVLPLISSISVN